MVDVVTDTKLLELDAGPRAPREAYWRGAVSLSSRAPYFELKDPDGKVYKLSDYRNNGIVILEFGAIT
jgi:hypothetical protein